MTCLVQILWGPRGGRCRLVPAPAKRLPIMPVLLQLHLLLTLLGLLVGQDLSLQLRPATSSHMNLAGLTGAGREGEARTRAADSASQVLQQCLGVAWLQCMEAALASAAAYLAAS